MFSKHSFPPNCSLLNKTKICCTTNVQLSYDRQSILCEHRTKFGIRETIVRLYHECIATVVRLSYDSSTVVFFLKWFMLIPTTMCLSHDSRTIVVRHSDDSHKTVTRQKIVEQKRCMSKFPVVALYRCVVTRNLVEICGKHPIYKTTNGI